MIIGWHNLGFESKRIIFNQVRQTIILGGDMVSTHGGPWDALPEDKAAIASRYNMPNPAVSDYYSVRDISQPRELTSGFGG